MTEGAGWSDAGAWLALAPSPGGVAGSVAVASGAGGVGGVEIVAVEGAGVVVEAIGGVAEQPPKIKADPAASARNEILPELRMAASVCSCGRPFVVAECPRSFKLWPNVLTRKGAKVKGVQP